METGPHGRTAAKLNGTPCINIFEIKKNKKKIKNI